MLFGRKFIVVFATFMSFSLSAAIQFHDSMGEAGDGIYLYMGPSGRLELRNEYSAIKIMRGEEEVKDATFSINGVQLKINEMGYVIDESIKIPGLGAGKTLTFEGKSGADSVKVVITCPADPQVTAPLEGADYTPGGKVKAAWSSVYPKPVEFSFGAKAVATMAIWDSANKREKNFGGFVKPLDMGGAQSGELVLPSSLDFQNAPMVKFLVPGEKKDGLRCTLVKSVALKISR